jgi:hypothetical protein
VRLRDVLKPGTTTIGYLYDFGDSWEHRLTVADVRIGDPGATYPRYVGGERNAPPEDCGGIPGFYDMLDALADPDHPSYAGATEWGDAYEPDIIDELPIKYALLRIARRRNAAKARLTESTRPKSDT